MLIPDNLKSALPAWNQTEGVSDSQKVCQGKLMTLNGERTLYLIEGLHCDDYGWTFMVISKLVDGFSKSGGDWTIGAWTENEIEEYRDAEGNAFVLDPYFKPCTVASLTSAFNKE